MNSAIVTTEINPPIKGKMVIDGKTIEVLCTHSVRGNVGTWMEGNVATSPHLWNTVKLPDGSSKTVPSNVISP